MKKLRISVVLIVLLFLTSNVFAREEIFDIKVGNQINNGGSAVLESDGRFTVYKSGEQVCQSDEDIIVTAKENRVSLKTSDYQGIGAPKEFLIKSTSPIGYGKYKYRGDFTFCDGAGKIFVINRIGLEDYIKGVVPKELYYTVPSEALKAQAVASRGFALANKDKFIKYGYNLDDTAASQAYQGYSAETPETNRAVEETKGLIPLYKGKPANTIFHATSGGITEALHEVWGGNKVPYLVSLDDPISVNTTHATWDYKIDKKEFLNILQRKFPKSGRIQKITILSRLPSGRVKELELAGSKGTQVISGNAFRSALGSTKLKSTLFFFGGESQVNRTVITANGKRPLGTEEKIITSSGTADYSSAAEEGSSLDLSGSVVRIHGKGYGHGVGMSQYGAINMAEEGKNFREIIEFYYPGVTIGK